MCPVGDYYKWITVELARTAAYHSLISKIFLFPAFVWFILKRPSKTSVDLLCMGYHVLAEKKRA